MFGFSNKPKILYYVDSYATQIVAEQYKKYLIDYQIDIVQNDWQDRLQSDNYDIVCHTNLTLLMWEIPDIISFIKKQHERGTKIVIYDCNQIITTSEQGVIYDCNQIITSLEIYNKFDKILVNNAIVFETLNKLKLPVSFISEGLDLTNLGPDVPFQKRSFKIASRKNDFLWQQFRQKWPKLEFIEIFDKNICLQDLNQIYNECQVFYGSTGFMEAAACGVIPVMRNRTGLEKFKNIFALETDDSVIETIISLKENTESTLISQRISKEMLSWDYKFVSHQWGKNIEEILLKKKAISFT